MRFLKNIAVWTYFLMAACHAPEQPGNTLNPRTDNTFQFTDTLGKTYFVYDILSYIEGMSHSESGYRITFYVDSGVNDIDAKDEALRKINCLYHAITPGGGPPPLPPDTNYTFVRKGQLIGHRKNDTWQVDANLILKNGNTISFKENFEKGSIIMEK